MSAKLSLRCWFVAVLCVILANANPAAAQLKIYINTDLEGASGVFKFSQTREADTPLAREAREYFMGDLAAVIRGLREAGATEILVLDGHGSQSVIPHLMEPGAKYATGNPKPNPKSVWGVDETYAGMVLFGFHAMMGTPDGVLCHTRNSQSENRYWFNGVESGEMALVATIAGCYGVPPIMATGDEATCREARQFFGDNIVTVPVKKGLSREAAVLYPFAETRQALYEGAKRAVAAIPKCKPYKLTLPIQAKKTYLDRSKDGGPAKLITREGTIEDALRIWDF